MYVTLSDLGQQSTNLIQAKNAYSRGRTVLGQGNTALARNYLSELQFTYNNAKNAGNDSEAQEILRLINFLSGALNPGATPVAPQAAPQNFAIDMSTTRAAGGSTPRDGDLPGGPLSGSPRGPNYLLWGGLALGTAALVAGGAVFMMSKSGAKKSEN